ncbi:putative ABC transport system permease protein [Litoreibacter ponti]|uniref:Putative ABC transport system permease protein n=1 Tax=Litoreibacter ponti TaxID=1510457 RepID=A0A2T6BCL3_9RHOB|nr:ABC transporter permease DevC [Litoreibacter ponti]PTX53803.1 putative ABC transport system permease protein [Litoreibacter ponti]
MSRLLQSLFGRLPIGWLQLSHSKTRFAAAIAGVAFATLLVFMQLGILGALNSSTIAPYGFFEADIMVSSEDANTLTDGSNVARSRLFQSLGVAGVASGTELYIGNLEFQLAGGSTATLQTFGLTNQGAAFVTPDIAAQFDLLIPENTALIDTATRGVSKGAFDSLRAGNPFPFEIKGQTLTAVGTLEMGGGFSADGTLFVSDQTFLRFFPNRSSGAPNHILLNVSEGAAVEDVVASLRKVLPADAVKVQSLEAAASADLAYQTTERPTGIIFGFGVLIGIIVGIVIVYQVLSTDVADHLSEYATFKAMGYGQPFFLGIVFEEALVLAIFGFVPGLAVSVLLYMGMSAATGLPVEMDGARIISVFVGTVVACSLSGAIATRRLAGADPADLF